MFNATPAVFQPYRGQGINVRLHYLYFVKTSFNPATISPNNKINLKNLRPQPQSAKKA